MSKHVDVFVCLAERSMNIESIRALVSKSSFDEQVSFHKIHERLMELAPEKTRSKMELAYPFVKLAGRWHFSTVNFWSYLRAAEKVIIMTKDKRMIACFNAYSRMRKYTKDCQDLFDSLSPKEAENYRDYQEKMADMYKVALMEQRSIFDAIR